jgi:hypothetical protein
MIKRPIMMIAACAVILFVTNGLMAQQLYDPNEPGSVLVFPKVVRGTVAAGVPATEIEISAHCPTVELDGTGFCPDAGTTVRVRAHWVCPGQFSTQVCKEVDFNFQTTVEGTATFNTEGSPAGSSFATVRVPPAPCPEGYLIAWVTDTSGRPIKFDSLVGDAVVRWNNHAAGAYEAVAIQAVAALANKAVIVPTATGALPFNGTTGYAAPTGTVMATIKYDTDAGTPAAADTPSTTSLTLLTLDTLSNRPNFPVFTDLNFYDANEFLVSESTNYTCWEEIPVSSIDPGLVRENMTRKGFFYSIDANKIPIFGIADAAGPVTQLGLIDTVECPGNASGTCTPLTAPVTASNNPSIVNHYMYRAYDDSVPVPTLFVP